LVLLGLFGLCILPCGGVMVLGYIVAFPTFVAYEAPDKIFRAEFPGKAYTFTRPEEGGVVAQVVEFKRSFPEETYFISYVDLTDKALKPGTAEVLKTAADHYISSNPGTTEVTRKSANHDGHSSVEMELEDVDGENVTLVHFILVGKRLYTIGITSNQISAEEPRATHFFSTFKVNAVPALAPNK
jgi:hypothetical protein